jgi:hypothetical protein
VRRAVEIALAALILVSGSGTAYADGAFPDSENVLTPADRPEEIWLVTNFGLIASRDRGGSWEWTCEQPGNAFGIFYQWAQPPRRRLYAVANEKVAYSDDDSCTWRTGRADGQIITDVYADPGDGDRVVAVGVSNQIHSVLESTDGGTTFDRMLYVAPAGDAITGVEIARSDPRILYLTMATGPDLHPTLARSTDGGANWTFANLATALGPGTVRLIAVDDADPRKVFLLGVGIDGQSLAVVTDGGSSVALPLSIDGAFNAFVRLPDGTVLISGLVGGATEPALFRSRDGAVTFERLAGHPRVRALSYRAGVIYAATDNFGDGYALAASDDGGDVWRPVMAYADVRATRACVREHCRTLCEAEPIASLWQPEVCSADGSGGAGGRGGGGSGGTAGTSGGQPGGASGGGCQVGGDPFRPDVASLLVACSGVVLRRGRRRRAIS